MKTKHDSRKERGAVLLEMVLVLPLLILLSFSAIELSRILKITQAANVLSREAASMAYRTCSDFREQTTAGVSAYDLTVARTSSCILEVLDDGESGGVQGFADNVYGAGVSKIIITVVRYDSISGAPSLWTVQQSGASAIISDVTRFSFNTAGGDVSGPVAISNADLVARERFVIAEVYFHYEMMIGFLPFIPETLNYYEATVL